MFRNGKFVSLTRDFASRLDAGLYALGIDYGAVLQTGDVLLQCVQAWPLDGDSGPDGYERLMREVIREDQVERALEAARSAT